ncbi:MAG TPA: alpha/beta hydrolase [Opitutaceae bacterium]|nr:alpha/beta hydrolase [Opitutaceae bacterium]
MKVTLALVCLTLVSGTSAFAADTPLVLPLWPNGAPGAEARRNEPEKVTGQNVSNIHNPTLTVYLPTTAATGVGVIVCPGGGHRFLVVKKEGSTIAEWLAAHGIAGFVLKNRLARDNATPAGTPQPYTIDRDELADAQRAIRLVREHAAEWGVAPSKIGIIGFSAGGELTAVTAMHAEDGDPHAADPVDRLDGRPDFQGLIYPGQSQRIMPQRGAPPAFLACGANDRPDISEGVPQAYLRFKQAGVPVEMHVYAGIGHGFGLRPGPAHGWADAFRNWLVTEKFIAEVSASPKPER